MGDVYGECGNSMPQTRLYKKTENKKNCQLFDGIFAFFITGTFPENSQPEKEKRNKTIFERFKK